jgi:hypothetical protein
VKLASEATSPTLKEIYQERVLKAKKLLEETEKEYENLK